MARLKGLSDGVVAFALTLLVLDLRLPLDATAATLPAGLLALGPALLVYLMSFAIIGGSWGSHQRMLGQIDSGDGLLVWYNLASLLPITLLPACASLLGDFPNQFPAVAVFALDALAIQLTAYGLWRHASRHGLLEPTLEGRTADGIGRRLLINAAGFGLSIPLALISPVIAYALWVGVFALVFTTDWLSWQQTRRTTTASLTLDGAARAQVRIRHVTGRLHVDATDRDDALLDGVFGGGVDSAVSRQDGRAEVELATPPISGLLSPRYPWAWGRFWVDWDLRLTGRIPLSLSVETTGGTADLDLEGVHVRELDVRADGSSVEIRLPADAGAMTVELESKAALVSVHIPDGVAARIHSEKEVPGLSLDVARFPSVVDRREYRSSNYDRSPNRVDIAATSLAGDHDHVSGRSRRAGLRRQAIRSASPMRMPSGPRR
jgi:uncharacterized membrane protein